MTSPGHRTEGCLVIAPTGERLLVRRDVNTGTQAVVDTSTGRP